MREKQWVNLDYFRRKLFIKYEIKKVILHSLIHNHYVSNSYKYIALYKKSNIFRWSNVIQQNNRCFLSGRPWYVSKITRLSRFKFRSESGKGNLPGFKRASW